MGKGKGKAAYPVQPTVSYPTQAPSGPPPAGYGAPPTGYGYDAAMPPPYAPPGSMPQYYPPQPYGMNQFQQQPYMGGNGLTGFQPQQPMMQPGAAGYSSYNYSPNGQPVVVKDAFDAGARFDGVSQPSIPPPPPGCHPNAAQMASSQGHSVVMQQSKSDFLTGGTGGGYALI